MPPLPPIKIGHGHAEGVQLTVRGDPAELTVTVGIKEKAVPVCVREPEAVMRLFDQLADMVALMDEVPIVSDVPETLKLLVLHVTVVRTVVAYGSSQLMFIGVNEAEIVDVVAPMFAFKAAVILEAP